MGLKVRPLFQDSSGRGRFFGPDWAGSGLGRAGLGLDSAGLRRDRSGSGLYSGLLGSGRCGGPRLLAFGHGSARF